MGQEQEDFFVGEGGGGGLREDPMCRTVGFVRDFSSLLGLEGEWLIAGSEEDLDSWKE